MNETLDGPTAVKGYIPWVGKVKRKRFGGNSGYL
jgi:hypothetical protein